MADRAANSIVFGFKHLMVSKWNFAKYAMWVDDEHGEVWVGNEKALRVVMKDSSVNIVYGDGWEAWLNDEEHPDFKELVQYWNQKLAAVPMKGAGKAGKADGKGKSKPAR